MEIVAGNKVQSGWNRYPLGAKFVRDPRGIDEAPGPTIPIS